MLSAAKFWWCPLTVQHINNAVLLDPKVGTLLYANDVIKGQFYKGIIGK